jgi:hypothetical protein
MHGWITWFIFTGCFAATIAALVLNVFYCQAEDDVMTYSVTLFRGCIVFPALGLDTCSNLNWGDSSEGKANKANFAAIAGLEIALLIVCFVGKILSCFQRRGRSMGPALMWTAVTAGLLASAAWITTIHTYLNNKLVLAVEIDGVSMSSGVPPMTKTWSDTRTVPSANFAIMIAVSIACIVNFCFAWRIHRLAQNQVNVVGYAVVQPVIVAAPGAVYYAMPANNGYPAAAPNNGYPATYAAYPAANNTGNGYTYPAQEQQYTGIKTASSV